VVREKEVLLAVVLGVVHQKEVPQEVELEVHEKEVPQEVVLEVGYQKEVLQEAVLEVGHEKVVHLKVDRVVILVEKTKRVTDLELEVDQEEK